MNYFDVAKADALLKEAYLRMETELNAAIYRAPEGPALPPPPWSVRWLNRARAFWLRAREWIAVHVLRVELRGEDY